MTEQIHMFGVLIHATAYVKDISVYAAEERVKAQLMNDDLKPPRVGTLGLYRRSPVDPGTVFKVTSVEKNICHVQIYMRREGNGAPDCFSWRFKDGLNVLHWWRGKPEGRNCPYQWTTPSFDDAEAVVAAFEARQKEEARG